MTNADNGVRLDLKGMPFKYPSLMLPEAEYAHVCNEISAYYSRYKGKSVAYAKLTEAIYAFENRGFGDYNIFGKE